MYVSTELRTYVMSHVTWCWNVLLVCGVCWCLLAAGARVCVYKIKKTNLRIT